MRVRGWSLWALVCGISSVVAMAAESEEKPSETVVVEETPIQQGDREFWSFKPLKRPAVPETQSDWARNAIDQFILARLAERKLEPQPSADRVTLIRRLTFDLTGLPPTPEEVDAFLEDRSPDAYEKLVDRLLAAESYGIRWGQHWLDLARFAETDGFEHDKLRPNAWRYRDWVIAALNEDMPYDRFLTLQLAGDEAAAEDPSARIATGFLLCGPDMPDINSQDERRHVFLNDMTSTVGAVFLGLQVGCAQCHDHKFDPISQHDFYRLRAFFDFNDVFKQHPVATAAELREHEAREAEKARRMLTLTRDLKQIETQTLARMREAEQNPKLRADKKTIAKHFSDEEKTRHQKMSAELETLQKQKSSLPMGRVMQESREVGTSLFWIRGDWRRPGPAVEPDFLRVVNPAAQKPSLPDSDDAGTKRRLALARWLTQPDHPLTTRVIVNRIWQHHFGEGISRSPSDFGTMGEWPTHPELLDWLATELPRRGWSLKSLHKLIVTSATYRQQSRPTAETLASWKKNREVDPDNKLLGRMPIRRLEGEAIRDAMLAASEGLSDRAGGPGVRPPLPNELLNTVHKGHWDVSPDEEDHRRRSIYLFVRRNLRYPLFDIFDRPDTNASCPRRNRSTIAPQALTLLNSEFSLKAARRLCGYVLEKAGTDSTSQVECAYRRAFGRLPSDAEREAAVAFLEENAETLRKAGRSAESLALPETLADGADVHGAAALTDLCLALFNMNEFVYID